MRRPPRAGVASASPAINSAGESVSLRVSCDSHPVSTATARLAAAAAGRPLTSLRTRTCGGRRVAVGAVVCVGVGFGVCVGLGVCVGIGVCVCVVVCVGVGGFGCHGRGVGCHGRGVDGPLGAGGGETHVG